MSYFGLIFYRLSQICLVNDGRWGLSQVTCLRWRFLLNNRLSLDISRLRNHWCWNRWVRTINFNISFLLLIEHLLYLLNSRRVSTCICIFHCLYLCQIRFMSSLINHSFRHWLQFRANYLIPIIKIRLGIFLQSFFKINLHFWKTFIITLTLAGICRHLYTVSSIRRWTHRLIICWQLLSSWLSWL